MHSALVKDSSRLQLLVRILMDAARPLSSNDIYDIAKEMASGNVSLLSASSIGTCIGEVRLDPDYYISGRKVPGRQYNEYWLTKAPGWTPRWIVNSEGRVIPYRLMMENRTPASEQEFIPPQAKPAETITGAPAGPLRCVSCKETELPPDHKGAPLCARCRESLFGLKEAVKIDS